MLHPLNQHLDLNKNFSIAGPAGKLELLVEKPRLPPIGVTVVICHPHPQHEGTMHNKVVSTAARAFREAGAQSVRFNFRGVGQSEGSYGAGVGEIADLRAVIEWVKQQRPHDKLWLAGFSFGAMVALSASTQANVELLVAIAPPVHYPEFKTLKPAAKACYIIQGEQDEIVDLVQVYAWVEAQHPKPVLIRLADASHFFHGKLNNLKQVILSLVNNYCKTVSL